MNTRLELVSVVGDQMLARVRFVVHGTSNVREADAIMSLGLRFTEGRPTVSTNLIHAQDWTVNPEKQAQSWGEGMVPGETGRVVLSMIPSQFHVGYGVFTTAYIDRASKQVMGAPLRYAAARKQLAFYMAKDTESARANIEGEVAGGYGLAQHPQFNLEPQHMVGSFDGRTLAAITKPLDVTIRALEPLDYGRIEGALRDLFYTRVAAEQVLVSAAMHDLVVGTAESIVISRLRMMRWQGLGLLGYRFYEGQQEVQITPVRDMMEQMRRIDEWGRKLASSTLFTQDLAWLKTYAIHQLELMRTELEVAELEAAPD